MTGYNPQTWGSWDVRCLNAVMKVPELAEVRILVYDKLSRVVVEEMRWESVVQFGPRHLDGRYSDIVLNYQQAQFRLQFAAQDAGFSYKITPSGGCESLCFFIAGLFRWNRPGRVERVDDRLILSTGAQSWTVTVLGKPVSLPINTTYPRILVDGCEPVYIRCNHTQSPTAIDAAIQAKAIEGEAQSVRGGGFLADAPQAIVKGILWNTIYEPTHDRFCTPVTRDWCIIKPERPWFGSYVLFTWDTSFAGLLSGLQDASLAYQQIYSLLDEMTSENIPCTTSEVTIFADRSQLPITTYCALKLFHQFGEISFLQKIFDPLLVHHRWWFKYRDGNGDGLLEWGTNMPVTHDNLRGYLNVAMAESGLDNSPMYDETCFNPDSHTMELADVGLNCVYALDAWALAEIADLLGREPEAQVLCQEYAAMKERINREFWNDALGIYCNKHWDGRFSPILGPSCFYPMLAGIAPQARAERMVREHLLNEEEFWGEFVIPVSPRNHPSFQDNDYWRGRIWAPTNYLVSEGLKRYGFYEESYAVARKSLTLFLKEWQEENHIHENYNTLTGEGDDVYNADPVYTWGGLLAYLGLSELIEVQPEGGLRLGNLSGEEASIENFCVHGCRYTVQSGSRLVVDRDQRLWLETNLPMRLTNVRIKQQTVFLRVESKHTGTIHFYPLDGIDQVVVEMKGDMACAYPIHQDSGVTIQVEGNESD